MTPGRYGILRTRKPRIALDSGKRNTGTRKESRARKAIMRSTATDALDCPASTSGCIWGMFRDCHGAVDKAGEHYMFVIGRLRAMRPAVQIGGNANLNLSWDPNNVLCTTRY